MGSYGHQVTQSRPAQKAVEIGRQRAARPEGVKPDKHLLGVDT